MKSSAKNIIGIDPGYGTSSPTGIALITTNGDILTIDTIWPENKKEPINKRLGHLMDRALTAIEDTSKSADLLCIESTVMRGKGGETLQRLIGAYLATFYWVDLELVQNTTIKKVVGGTGKADKEAVSDGVYKWFAEEMKNSKSSQMVENLIASENWDVIDALAIAIAGYKRRYEK